MTVQDKVQYYNYECEIKYHYITGLYFKVADLSHSVHFRWHS